MTVRMSRPVSHRARTTSGFHITECAPMNIDLMIANSLTTVHLLGYV